ncbi:MAG: hypothetical protein ACJ8BC_10300 [Gemmatimonadales bacterium]
MTAFDLARDSENPIKTEIERRGLRVEETNWVEDGEVWERAKLIAGAGKIVAIGRASTQRHAVALALRRVLEAERRARPGRCG